MTSIMQACQFSHSFTQEISCMGHYTQTNPPDHQTRLRRQRDPGYFRVAISWRTAALILHFNAISGATEAPSFDWIMQPRRALRHKSSFICINHSKWSKGILSRKFKNAITTREEKSNANTTLKKKTGEKNFSQL